MNRSYATGQVGFQVLFIIPSPGSGPILFCGFALMMQHHTRPPHEVHVRLDETRDCPGPVHVQLGYPVRLNTFCDLLYEAVPDEYTKTVADRSICCIQHASVPNEEIALAFFMFSGSAHGSTSSTG